MRFDSATWLVVCACACACAGERWSWPEGAASVRIDTKVRFIDNDKEVSNRNSNRNVQSDEVPFHEPTNTEGFYNRPPGEGRFPVHVEPHRTPSQKYQARPNTNGYNNGYKQVESDGTLDSLQYCKCMSSPNCNPVPDKYKSCGANEYLCCFDPPISHHNSEFFNEVDDERPFLLPGQTNIEGPFPPAPEGAVNHRPTDGRRQTQGGILVGPQGPTGNVGIPRKPVLIGPGGPTGLFGPEKTPNVLVGPEGPTGVIGPANVNRNPGVLVGPGGQDIGQSESAQRGVLVGPGGPTGIIGPQYNRPVLVGPGGPTGIIGPRQGGFLGAPRRGVLVGPGGPTGFIGPAGFQQRQNPGVLVGPGGPTGIIGPGRQVLVGPGGPTGQIGPRRYFGN